MHSGHYVFAVCAVWYFDQKPLLDHGFLLAFALARFVEAQGPCHHAPIKTLFAHTISFKEYDANAFKFMGGGVTGWNF